MLKNLALPGTEDDALLIKELFGLSSLASRKAFLASLSNGFTPDALLRIEDRLKSRLLSRLELSSRKTEDSSRSPLGTEPLKTLTAIEAQLNARGYSKEAINKWLNEQTLSQKDIFSDFSAKHRRRRKNLLTVFFNLSTKDSDAASATYTYSTIKQFITECFSLLKYVNQKKSVVDGSGSDTIYLNDHTNLLDNIPEVCNLFDFPPFFNFMTLFQGEQIHQFLTGELRARTEYTLVYLMRDDWNKSISAEVREAYDTNAKMFGYVLVAGKISKISGGEITHRPAITIGKEFRRSVRRGSESVPTDDIGSVKKYLADNLRIESDIEDIPTPGGVYVRINDCTISNINYLLSELPRLLSNRPFPDSVDYIEIFVTYFTYSQRTHAIRLDRGGNILMPQTDLESVDGREGFDRPSNIFHSFMADTLSREEVNVHLSRIFEQRESYLKNYTPNGTLDCRNLQNQQTLSDFNDAVTISSRMPSPLRLPLLLWAFNVFGLVTDRRTERFLARQLHRQNKLSQLEASFTEKDLTNLRSMPAIRVMTLSKSRRESKPSSSTPSSTSSIQDLLNYLVPENTSIEIKFPPTAALHYLGENYPGITRMMEMIGTTVYAGVGVGTRLTCVSHRDTVNLIHLIKSPMLIQTHIGEPSSTLRASGITPLDVALRNSLNGNKKTPQIRRIHTYVANNRVNEYVMQEAVDLIPTLHEATDQCCRPEKRTQLSRDLVQNFFFGLMMRGEPKEKSDVRTLSQLSSLTQLLHHELPVQEFISAFESSIRGVKVHRTETVKEYPERFTYVMLGIFCATELAREGSLSSSLPHRNCYFFSVFRDFLNPTERPRRRGKMDPPANSKAFLPELLATFRQEVMTSASFDVNNPRSYFSESVYDCFNHFFFPTKSCGFRCDASQRKELFLQLYNNVGLSVLAIGSLSTYINQLFTHWMSIPTTLAQEDSPNSILRFLIAKEGVSTPPALFRELPLKFSLARFAERSFARLFNTVQSMGPATIIGGITMCTAGYFNVLPQAMRNVSFFGGLAGTVLSAVAQATTTPLNIPRSGVPILAAINGGAPTSTYGPSEDNRTFPQRKCPFGEALMEQRIVSTVYRLVDYQGKHYDSSEADDSVDD